MKPRELNGEDMLKLQTIVDNKSLVVNDIILKSMEIISELTHYTTVVLGSTSHENLLKQVEVIPIDEENNVYLETQYRFPIGRMLLEAPAGKLDSKQVLLRILYSVFICTYDKDYLLVSYHPATICGTNDGT